MSLTRQLKSLQELLASNQNQAVIDRTNNILIDTPMDTKAQLMYLRGEAFSAMKNYDAASIAYRKAEGLGYQPVIETVATSSPSIVVNNTTPVVRSPTTGELYAAADLKYGNKNYNGAIDDLNNAIALNPNFEKAFELRMKAKYSLSQFAETIQDATCCIKFNGSCLGEAYLHRSYSNYALEKHTEAGDDAEKAIQHGYKNNAELYYYVALKKFNNKDYQDAIQQATKSIETTYNKTAKTYLIRAKAKFASSDYNGALTDAQACATLNPDDYWDIRNSHQRISSFKSDYLTLIADAYRKLNKQTDALKSEIAAFDYQKNVTPLPLTTLCKFFIFANHGKVMASGPSAYDGNFNALRAVLAKHNVTPETIHITREMQQLPTTAPTLFNALNDEEELRSRLGMYEKAFAVKK